MAGQFRDRFRLGDWVIDPRRDVIARGTTTIKLVPRTMQVLLFLAERAGDVVSQAEIEEAVWGTVIVTPSSVYQAITDLRRALGDDRHRPTHILTIARKGYQLVAPVVPITDKPVAPIPPAPSPEVVVPAPEAVAPAPAATSAAVPRPRRRRSDRWRERLASRSAVATYIGAAIAIMAIWAWLPGRTPQTAGEVDAPPKSIAVLPITDLSAARDDTHFAEGLSEEMMSTLSQIPGLKVAARTSVYLFKDRAEDVRRIGQQLGTRYVLEGSVRRSGDKLRVTAQLIDARNGYHLWSRNFDRPAGEVIALQEDIAHAVADSLEVSLAGDAIPRLVALRRAAPESYQLYMLGRHFQRQRRPDAIAQAVDYGRQAIAKDRRFALAYAGLADALMSEFYYNNRPLAEAAAAMEPVLARGFALDPNLPELYASRGVLRTQQFRLDEARRDLERAVALDPGSAEPMVRLGISHEYAGRTRDALKLLDRALALDPLHFMLHIRRCLALQNLGRYKEAEQACARARELDPEAPNGPWTRGLIALSAGRQAGAVEGYREALALSPDRIDLLGQLGYLYLDLGLLPDAEAAFQRATAIEGPAHGFAFLARARLHVAKGDLPALRAYLDAVGPEAPREVGDAVDLALLELVAGRPAAAQRYAAIATANPDYDPRRLLDVWHVRWAHSDTLSLALVAAAGNRPAEAARHLSEIDAFLDHLERNGNLWHGLHYLRAAVRAQQGRKKEAIAELGRAVALGWRRAWWTAHDPALASLRASPAYVSLLQTMTSAAAQERARLDASTAHTTG